MKIYLASPLFNEIEKQAIATVVKNLREQGHEVYSPVEHQIDNAWDYSNSAWGEKVFQEDIKAIQCCEAVVALYYGLYSDSGTAWECGYAYGLNKKVYVVNCTPSDEQVSLMIANSIRNKPIFANNYQS